MPELKLSGLIQMPLGDVDALLRVADGNAALLYMFILRHSRLPQEGEAGGLEGKAAKAALKALEGAGLVSLKEIAQAEEATPAYTAKDISEGLARDESFKFVVSEAERVFGKLLSSQDLSILYRIYDWRGLPADVLIMLLKFCAEDFRAYYGPESRPPTMGQIDKEARRWAEAGILSHEAAERHIAEKELTRGQTARFLSVLGISGRAASETEKKYINAWIGMGFPRETAALAYDRTVVNCGRLNWKYMDKILRNWHEAGLHTPREVESGDTKPARPQGYAPSAPRERSNRPIAPPGEAELAAMERMMNKGKKKGEGK
ncbi:MAG: DnaD domain protein [Oscillospiraceae bacterium]|jgi:DnaD/phage-associated family protein|nr:DnaD domain protein [Oscillospiraceae bacterium]